MRICIYQDYLHNNGALHKVLCNRYGKLAVDFVDAEDIKAGALAPKKVDVFIMPGGESRYVADKLNGRGNELIRDYVVRGGTYLGICAGAYYACSKTVWREGDEKYGLTVDNELKFFNGVAKGPIETLPCFTNARREIPAQITKLEFPNGIVDPFLYWGGSVFEGEMDNINVLARFHDVPGKPPAIIMGSLGIGKFILSSAHIEFDPEIFDLIQYDVPRNAHEDLNGLDGKRLSSYFLYECINKLT